MLAVALLVLGSTVFFITGLAGSGITWTDGQASYGVPGGDVSRFLPPGLAHVVAVVMLLAFLFSPVLMVPIVIGAAVQLRSSWRSRSSRDTAAIATLVVASAFVVLLAFWGDELWVWILD